MPSAKPPRPRPEARPLKKRSPPLDAIAAADVPVNRAMLWEARTELLERIDQARNEVKTEIRSLDSRIHGLEGQIHGLKADLARIASLVEEQNARNKVVPRG